MAALATILYLICITIIDGFILKVLWGWFMVSTFGLPAINVPQAIGVSLVIGFLTYHYTENNGDKEDKIKRIIMSIVMPFVFLLLGFIVHLFM